MKTPSQILEGSPGACSRRADWITNRVASTFTGRNGGSRPQASARYASRFIHAPWAVGEIMSRSSRSCFKPCRSTRQIPVFAQTATARRETLRSISGHDAAGQSSDQFRHKQSCPDASEPRLHDSRKPRGITMSARHRKPRWRAGPALRRIEALEGPHPAVDHGELVQRECAFEHAIDDRAQPIRTRQ